VESEVGQGSTFHFTARLGRAEAAPPRPPGHVPADLAGLCVLVVDDNATNRRILEEVLSSWRLRPTAVASAAEALHALERQAQAGEPFRLALLDAMMPEVDGFTLAEEIRRRPALEGLALVLLTSGVEREASRCRELGIAVTLLKPAKQSELLDAIQAAVHGEAPREARAEAAAAPVARPLRLLLAEDSPINQRLAVTVLEKRGHAVTVANNGREALAALGIGDPAAGGPDGTRRFDVVLMDVQMPEMDGFEATARIREHERGTGGHIPIIAMTAYAMKGDRERCLAAGMDRYISKPIQAAQLLQALAEVLPGAAPAAAAPAPAAPPVEMLLDPETALERAGGDEALLAELAELFRAEAPERLAEIRAAITRQDAVALARAAHTLKGAAAVFGAAGAVEAARELEAMGRGGDLAGAAAAADRLADILESLKPALAELAGARKTGE
jgi:CheY-like chemotaxis protein/HPt (histidine-containing phosphotransfer) domain-containing protein